MVFQFATEHLHLATGFVHALHEACYMLIHSIGVCMLVGMYISRATNLVVSVEFHEE